MVAGPGVGQEAPRPLLRPPSGRPPPGGATRSPAGGRPGRRSGTADTRRGRRPGSGRRRTPPPPTRAPRATRSDASGAVCTSSATSHSRPFLAGAAGGRLSAARRQLPGQAHQAEGRPHLLPVRAGVQLPDVGGAVGGADGGAAHGVRAQGRTQPDLPSRAGLAQGGWEAGRQRQGAAEAPPGLHATGAPVLSGLARRRQSLALPLTVLGRSCAAPPLAAPPAPGPGALLPALAPLLPRPPPARPHPRPSRCSGAPRARHPRMEHLSSVGGLRPPSPPGLPRPPAPRPALPPGQPPGAPVCCLPSSARPARRSAPGGSGPGRPPARRGP